MELAIRDKKIFQMKAELEHRKKLLCAKRQQLRQNKRENTLLEGVLQDYDNYNKRMIHENEQKIAFLKQLHSYIENITSELQLTDKKLSDSKNDQKDIMREIAKLKNEIDNMTNEI